MRSPLLFLAMMSSFTMAAPSSAADDQGGCASNFSVSGSFFTGKQYKTNVVLPGVGREIAFKKAYASVVKKGYQVTHSDKDVGVISVSQQVTGSAKTAPLNILVEPDGTGSKINFSFSTAGGLSAAEGAVRDEFCNITSDVLGR